MGRVAASAAAIAAGLRPQPGRAEFALRLALIGTLTAAVSIAYRMPEPALTAYVVFFLNRRDRVESVRLAAAMLVAATLLIGLVLLLGRATVDSAPLRVASIALASLALLLAVSASKLRPVGNTIALVVAYALDLLGTAPLGEAVTRGALYGWTFVAIPAAVSVAVNLLLGPTPRRLVERALARRARLAAQLLGDAGDGARRRLAECLREGSSELDAGLERAAFERSSPMQDLDALRQAARSSVALLAALDLSLREAGARPDAHWRASRARALAQIADVFDAGGYPIDIIVEGPANDEAQPSLAREVATAIDAAIAEFAQPPAGLHAAALPAVDAAPFLAPDAFSNPVHRRYAIKTSAAAMAAYLLYHLLGWPGIHTCFITCYIVSLGTVAESVEKLLLRLGGCLLGAALGVATLVWVLPGIESLPGMLAIVFAGIAASAWVAAGSARIAYAGLQIAFAFLLCVLQGPGPSFDMVVARDRVIGVLIGITIAYLVSSRMWPVSVAQRIDAGVAAALAALGRVAAATDGVARRQLAGRAQRALAAVHEDLALVGYEPAALRPSRRWLQRRRRVARQLDALQSPLLCMAERDPARADAPVALNALVERRLGELQRSLTALAGKGLVDAR